MSAEAASSSAFARVAMPGWQPRIIALVCHWCTYAGADMAGTARLTYPASVRIVRFPCTGRISPLYVLTAFSNGADGVVVSGCHPGDCHYVHGNLVARRRFAVLRSLLDFLGLDLRRLHFAWVSAAQGRKWADVVEEVTAAVREAGPLVGWGSEARSSPSDPVTFQTLDRAELHPASDGEREAVERHLRALAADLLERGEVQAVVGHSRATRSGRTVPRLIRHPGDASTLTWGEECRSNLAAQLLPALEGASRVALVVKSCDARSAMRLVGEGQVRREDVVLIAPACRGVTGNDGLAAKCRACARGWAQGCDYGVTADGVVPGGDVPAPGGELGADPRDGQIAQLEALPAEQRWHFWQRQFARCLRCYACRAVCPACYCTVCIARRHRPQWVPTPIDGRGNSAWNVIRALHMAGRCAGCDECTRACPAHIRLDLIHRKLALELEQRFGSQPAEDGAGTSPMLQFHLDDPEEFIR